MAAHSTSVLVINSPTWALSQAKAKPKAKSSSSPPPKKKATPAKDKPASKKPTPAKKSKKQDTSEDEESEEGQLTDEGSADESEEEAQFSDDSEVSLTVASAPRSVRARPDSHSPIDECAGQAEQEQEEGGTLNDSGFKS